MNKKRSITIKVVLLLAVVCLAGDGLSIIVHKIVP